MSRIEIEARGLEALYQWLLRSPEEIPGGAIDEAVEGLRELGETVMVLSIIETTGEKATGALAQSIQGETEHVSEDEWRVSVGSNLLPDAFFAAQEIRATAMFRPVQVMPSLRAGGFNPSARWRFIAIRPPMPAHPFLSETLAAWEKALPEFLGGRLEERAAALEREIKPLESEEE